MSPGNWEPLRQPATTSVLIDGIEVRAGSRVRLAPRPGADIMDIVLAGRAAIIEAVEQDLDGAVKLAVVIEDDPGRDLGFARSVGHRFFFDPSEVEPLDGQESPPPQTAPQRRVLVAGIGNVFLGDDGFGVRLAERLSTEPLPREVEVRDFGIRGLDLAFAMQEGYDTVIMLDATPRGQAPGTLYVIEVDPAEGEPSFDAHGMHPLAVLALVRACGQTPPPTLVLGCEPATHIDPDADEILDELSAPVQAALAPAVALARALLDELLTTPQDQEAVAR
jgi:hydrogenase maturation protease